MKLIPYVPKETEHAWLSETQLHSVTVSYDDRPMQWLVQLHDLQGLVYLYRACPTEVEALTEAKLLLKDLHDDFASLPF